MSMPSYFEGHELVDGRYEDVLPAEREELFYKLLSYIPKPEDPPFGNELYDNRYLVEWSAAVYACLYRPRWIIEDCYGESLSQLRSEFKSQNALGLYKQIMKTSGRRKR